MTNVHGRDIQRASRIPVVALRDVPINSRSIAFGHKSRLQIFQGMAPLYDRCAIAFAEVLAANPRTTFVLVRTNEGMLFAGEVSRIT